jgi:hypothetical protein
MMLAAFSRSPDLLHRPHSDSDLHATMHAGTTDPLSSLLHPVNLITSCFLRNHHLYLSRAAIWSSTT